MHCFAQSTKENTSRQRDAKQFGLGNPSSDKKILPFRNHPNGGGGRLPEYSQIVSWLVTHSGKFCVYTKRMIIQNFRVYEKKLARRRMYPILDTRIFRLCPSFRVSRSGDPHWILKWGGLESSGQIASS